jgi:hypothetical protein
MTYAFFSASSFNPRHATRVPVPSLSDIEDYSLESGGDNDTDIEIETPADWIEEQLEDLTETNASTMPARMLVEVRAFLSFRLHNHSCSYRHHHGRTRFLHLGLRHL